MRWDFSGKRAVVTGGARGIGRSIADALAAAGAEVFAYDRDVSGLSAVKGITFKSLDVTDGAAVAQAVKELPGAAHLLVNNAGIARDRTLLRMSDEEWDTVLAVNLKGAFNMTRAVAPGMVEQGYGRIVNITSINGIRGKYGQANYAASKAGLIGLTKTAARELGVKGVTVNAVAPGMVLTEMALALKEEFRAKALEESALKKLAEPSDIANGVLFLLSDAARMVTGQVLQVDAGQYL